MASYRYDDAGRRVTKTTTDGDVTRYGYDELGHLTRVTLPSGGIVQYTYDALGRRTGRTTDGAVDDARDTAWVYGSGPAPIAALTGDGTLRATFTYGTRSWVPDVVHIQNGPETPGDYVILTDHRGSVRYVAGDVTTDVSDYDAFGHRMGLGITIVGFGFAGGINDIQTGLVHLGARDYDPETGTWIEPDPIRFGGGDTNLYAYVGADPVDLVDPSGWYTEVVTWEPVGSGASSFGHTSVVINGRSFSFGPRGMDIGNAESYIERQLIFRSGRGLVLTLSPLEEASLESELETWSDPYGAMLDNCTDPLEHSLRDLGLRDARMNSLLPTGLARSLGSLAMGQTFYQGPTRAGSFIAPWSNAAYGSFWSMY